MHDRRSEEPEVRPRTAAEDAALVEEWVARLDRGVVWRDGKGSAHYFECFADEVIESVATFIRSRKGEPFEEAALWAFVIDPRVVEASSLHLPIEAWRRQARRSARNQARRQPRRRGIDTHDCGTVRGNKRDGS